MEDKKIAIIGAGSTGRSIAREIASHASLSNVIICDTEPEEIKRMNDMQNKLAAAMLLSATSRITRYGQTQGDNKKPKKKKRKRNKKTHR